MTDALAAILDERIVRGHWLCPVCNAKGRRTSTRARWRYFACHTCTRIIPNGRYRGRVGPVRWQHRRRFMVGGE